MTENWKRASSQISPSAFGGSENETPGQSHFLEKIVVLALLNSLGKDRAYPRLPISCSSPTPPPIKSHSNEYSTTHSKVLVFHASLNLWVESTGWSRFSCATEQRCVAFLHQFLNRPCLRCVATYASLASYCEPALTQLCGIGSGNETTFIYLPLFIPTCQVQPSLFSPRHGLALS